MACCCQTLQASLADAGARIAALEGMVRTLVAAVEELQPKRDFVAHVAACTERFDRTDAAVRRLDDVVALPDELLRYDVAACVPH